MKNRFDDNDKDFGREFPKPGVPADDAWKQMHELLVKHDLTQPVKKGRRKLVLLLVILFIMAGIGGYMFLNTGEEKGTSLTTIKHADSTITDQSKIDKDSVIYQRAEADTNKFTITEKTIPTANTTNKNYSLENFNKSFAISNSTAATQPAGAGKTGQPLDMPSTDAQQKNKVDAPAIAPQYNDSDTDTPIAITGNNNSTDTVATNNKINKASSGNFNKTATNKFHFGLQWNVNFSLKNNSHYFDAYNGGKQYYMWALPSAWAKMDIGKKHGVLFQFNPYKQVFAGKQTVRVEEPWIASIEPDIVTRAVKSRGYDLGLKYEYSYNKKLSVAAGFSYTFQRDVLYAEQAVDHISGNVLSEKIYGAKHNDVSFDYLRSSYLNWNASLKYDLKKISIGASVSQPLQNLSADPAYTLKPLNGELYLQYRFK